MREPMIEVSATVPRPRDVVLARVIELVRGLGGSRVEVDRDRGFVAMQGGWWYRGEYQVDLTSDGTRLTLRVRNVAEYARWAVPLANRLFVGYRAKVERNFARFAASLA